jgi:hypothetical protein
VSKSQLSNFNKSKRHRNYKCGFTAFMAEDSRFEKHQQSSLPIMRFTIFSGNGGFSPPPVKEWVAMYFDVNTPCIRSFVILITFNRLPLMRADLTNNSQHSGWLTVSAHELTNLKRKNVHYTKRRANWFTPISA